MTIISDFKKMARKVSGRPGLRLLTVSKAWRLTPNMNRVVFSGPELEGFPEGREGGNCKLLLPEPNETREAFADRLANGASLTKRTYTVRSFDIATSELAIDFVVHGDEGPASRWAMNANMGDFLGFAGPSGPKVTRYEANYYIVAADPSAIPIAAVTLETMPPNAKGIAIFEVTSLDDKQSFDAPAGIDIHWFVHPDPHMPSTAQEDFIRGLDWPDGRVQICIAGESGVIQSLRAFLHNEKQLSREDVYISGYWKIGLVEDEHQKTKRQEG